MVVFLQREVNNRIRYYNLYFYITLFGNFCVESIYGSKSNKKPTGAKRWWFDKEDDGLKHFKKILKTKKHKGYTTT